MPWSVWVDTATEVSDRDRRREPSRALCRSRGAETLQGRAGGKGKRLASAGGCKREMPMPQLSCWKSWQLQYRGAPQLGNEQGSVHLPEPASVGLPDENRGLKMVLEPCFSLMRERLHAGMDGTEYSARASGSLFEQHHSWRTLGSLW